MVKKEKNYNNIIKNTYAEGDNKDKAEDKLKEYKGIESAEIEKNKIMNLMKSFLILNTMYFSF